MASVNKVILLGYLGKDPELRYTQSGIAFCTFSLATTDHWTDQQGQRQEKTEWHRIQTWKKKAENCAKYLRKGSPAYVEGRLQTRSWDDQSGKKQYSTDIVAEAVKFLGQSQGKNGKQKQQQNADPPAAGHPYDNYRSHGSLDDLPF
jgi:single-strand DNA-binding protein